MSGDLWVFTWGRSTTPCRLANPAISSMLALSRSRSMSSAGVSSSSTERPSTSAPQVWRTTVDPPHDTGGLEGRLPAGGRAAGDGMVEQVDVDVGAAGHDHDAIPPTPLIPAGPGQGRGAGGLDGGAQGTPDQAHRVQDVVVGNEDH